MPWVGSWMAQTCPNTWPGQVFLGVSRFLDSESDFSHINLIYIYIHILINSSSFVIYHNNKTIPNCLAGFVIKGPLLPTASAVSIPQKARPDNDAVFAPSQRKRLSGFVGPARARRECFNTRCPVAYSAFFRKPSAIRSLAPGEAPRGRKGVLFGKVSVISLKNISFGCVLK